MPAGRLTDLLEKFGCPVLQPPRAPLSKPPVLATAAMRFRESCFRLWAALSRFVDEGSMIRKEYEYRRNELVVENGTLMQRITGKESGGNGVLLKVDYNLL